METSARNSLKSTVKKVISGSVNTEITLELGPGVKVVSIVTKSSAKRLDISKEKTAYAVVKVFDVMMSVD
ncbi:MAG: TOBE domain-containing protein [Waterburya sp.]